MKKNKIIDAIGLADERYIAEAAPSRGRMNGGRSGTPVPTRRIPRRIAAAAIAACFVLLTCVLFVPYRTTPPSVAKYENSEYYDIIVKLNEANFEAPRQKNRFQSLTHGVEQALDNFFLAKGAATMDSAPSASAPIYEETTDNQVSGVIEADLVKRSDKYIYYLNGSRLYVHTVDGERSRLVSEYKIDTEGVRYGYYDRWELYLSADCSTLTVIAPCTVKTDKFVSHVAVISLDVTDPANVTERGRVAVSGGLISSRLVNGKLLLVTEFYAGDANFSDESTFIPQIDTGDGTFGIPVEDIVSPETLTSSRYTVVCRFDNATLALEDQTALLSYSDDVYVSADNVYAVRRYNESVAHEELTYRLMMTEISAVRYSEEKFEHLGTVSVEGYLKDQYSLDEYDGMLRIVTTTSNTYVSSNTRTNALGIAEAVAVPAEHPVVLGTNASLYVVSLADFSIAAQVNYFAPPGETVRSVRFDGNAAYVCTAVQNTDPVFFFDLTDINDIKVKDTGTISGFSTSLVNMGNGFLLGIGQGESWGSVKIEVYEETDGGVRSVAVYEKHGASYAEDYKAYLIDRKNGLVGLGINFEYEAGEYFYDERERYVLLHFNGYDLIPVVNTVLEGDNAKKRGIVIGEYLYLLCESGEMTVICIGE